ncbi:MAG: MCE family protein [Solirubrobacterales bacterium]|nr:MCE family protein [Solirubrobacterales bacterium]
MSKFKAGLIGIIVIALICYGAVTKFANPFSSQYTIHAVFSSANQLRPQSLVRIAGINVGKVTSISPVAGCKVSPQSGPNPQCSAADVAMTIDSNGLPIHKDATFSIRPRIFLEGNFFVDVNPGTPEAPVAPDGWVFPIQQGTEPVQFDQLLNSLQLNTRANLQVLLQQYGYAVKTSGPDYNKSITYWLPAYEYGSEVSHDTLGQQPHDLSGWIDKGGTVNGALDAHPNNLKSLITNFNTTAGAFASQNQALQAAVAELPRTLQVAIPALNAVETDLCSSAAQPAPPNCAKGPLPRFADALTNTLTPGPDSTGTMISNSLPFFHQVRLLVSPSELGGCPSRTTPLAQCGLTANLAQTIPALAKLNQESIPFMKNGVRPASNCQVKIILPWSRLTLQDPNFNASNGFPPRPAYVEAVDFLPGLAGESRDFDANGPYVRVFLTGGTFTYSMSPGLFGTALNPIQGSQPVTPPLHQSGDGAPASVSRPPLEPNVACETQQQITDLSAPQGGAPQQMATSTSAPAALARQQSSGLIELAQLEKQDQQAGLGTRIVKSIPGIK